jgi:outer membrane protein insertion porin family
MYSKRLQIGTNSTLPVTISSIRLIGGAHTRRSFLDRLFKPLLSANRDRPYTLAEALNEVGSVATKLQRFGRCPASRLNQL